MHDKSVSHLATARQIKRRKKPNTASHMAQSIIMWGRAFTASGSGMVARKTTLIMTNLKSRSTKVALSMREMGWKPRNIVLVARARRSQREMQRLAAAMRPSWLCKTLEKISWPRSWRDGGGEMRGWIFMEQRGCCCLLWWWQRVCQIEEGGGVAVVVVSG